LKQQRASAEKIRDRVDELLSLVRLPGYQHRKPTSSPAEKNRGSRLPGPPLPRRRCCSSTSPCRPSTPGCAFSSGGKSEKSSEG
jgi:hypothetical protein